MTADSTQDEGRPEATPPPAHSVPADSAPAEAVPSAVSLDKAPPPADAAPVPVPAPAPEPPNPYAVTPPPPAVAAPGYPPYPPGGAGYPYPSPYATVPGPYGAWGVPQPARSFNGFAIASLVTALTCFLWPLAIAFGITGLVQIPKRRERGTGLAATGLGLSVLGLLVTVGVVTAAGARPGADYASGGSVSAAADLRTGDCFNRAGSEVHPLPCTSPHDGEVVGTMQLTGSSFPDQAERERQAGPICGGFADDFAMDNWAVPDSVVVHYFYPLSDSWAGGDRATTCFLTQDGRKLTGSLRKDASNTTGAQFSYLKAMDAIDAAAGKRPSGTVADDPAGYREWAATMAGVLQTQTDALAAGGWEPAVRTALDTQVAELRRRIPALRTAAQPAGVQELTRAIAESDRHRAYDQQKAVRQLLELSTDDSWLKAPARSDGAPRSV